MVAFLLVVKVVANPLLRLLITQPPKPPPGPLKTNNTKQKTKPNNNKSLFSSDPERNLPGTMNIFCIQITPE